MSNVLLASVGSERQVRAPSCTRDIYMPDPRTRLVMREWREALEKSGLEVDEMVSLDGLAMVVKKSAALVVPRSSIFDPGNFPQPLTNKVVTALEAFSEVGKPIFSEIPILDHHRQEGGLERDHGWRDLKLFQMSGKLSKSEIVIGHDISKITESLGE